MVSNNRYVTTIPRKEKKRRKKKKRNKKRRRRNKTGRRRKKKRRKKNNKKIKKKKWIPENQLVKKNPKNKQKWQKLKKYYFKVILYLLNYIRSNFLLKEKKNLIKILSKWNQELIKENTELKQKIFTLKNEVYKHVSFEDEDIVEVDDIIHSYTKKPKLEGNLLQMIY
jgi:hypothetical protein